MVDVKQFISSIKQIAEEKGIDEVKVIETIEAAIAAAYKKEYGKKGQIIKAKLDPQLGEVSMSQFKYAVEGVDPDGYIIGKLPDHSHLDDHDDVRSRFSSGPPPEIDSGIKPEAVNGSEVKSLAPENGDLLKVKFNPEKYLTLEEARKVKKKAKVGDEIVIKLETKTEFGRIAAQTAKQVIIQRLREAERETILNEFRQKQDSIVSGIIQRSERQLVYIDLGRTNGILPLAEQITQENYRIGQRFRFLVLRVEETVRGPVIVLSRSHPRLVNRLFEFEVPEIESGAVEIKVVAREAGSRSKVAVASNDDKVDPIGSLVGQKGVRVQAVINELGGEKIDVVEWSEDIIKFITNALSPAKILDVKIIDGRYRHALVEVADDQFSLAIGKKGQNVRLAAKLTGWRIDVRSPQETMFAEGAVSQEPSSKAAQESASQTEAVSQVSQKDD